MPTFSLNQVTLDDFTSPNFRQFDEIIDVRSPSEFEEDHIPNAINLPVLSDQQRVSVGTEYVQVSPYEARLRGASLISKNIGIHINEHFKSKSQNYKPLIYCWRGGQRSASLAEVCRRIGWNTSVLEGGYKQYRKLVHRFLYKEQLPLTVYLLGGNTGTAKTKILSLLSLKSTQILNLEELANHRGSIFGAVETKQPSQKKFESRLAATLSQLDGSRPVLIEAESSKIGVVSIPPSLWALMKTAKKIQIFAPVQKRAAYTYSTYKEITEKPEHLVRLIQSLQKFHAKKQIDAWCQLVKEGKFLELTEGLLTHHYDPLYKKGESIKQIELLELSNQSINGAADEVETFLKHMN